MFSITLPKYTNCQLLQLCFSYTTYSMHYDQIYSYNSQYILPKTDQCADCNKDNPSRLCRKNAQSKPIGLPSCTSCVHISVCMDVETSGTLSQAHLAMQHVHLVQIHTDQIKGEWSLSKHFWHQFQVRSYWCMSCKYNAVGREGVSGQRLSQS